MSDTSLISVPSDVSVFPQKSDSGLARLGQKLVDRSLATPATGWLARFVGSICLDLGFAGYVHCPSYVARLNQNEPQSR
jgi:hypothetical protein